VSGPVGSHDAPAGTFHRGQHVERGEIEAIPVAAVKLQRFRSTTARGIPPKRSAARRRKHRIKSDNLALLRRRTMRPPAISSGRHRGGLWVARRERLPQSDSRDQTRAEGQCASWAAVPTGEIVCSRNSGGRHKKCTRWAADLASLPAAEHARSNTSAPAAGGRLCSAIAGFDGAAFP
jgi:hypothetical protein